VAAMSKQTLLLSKWSHITFRQKLFAFSLLMSIVPVLLLGMIASYIMARSIQEEVNTNHQIILKQLEVQVDAFMQSLDKTSLALANMQTIQKSLASGISMNNSRASLDMIDSISKLTGNSEVEFEVSLYYTQYNVIYSSLSGVIRDLVYPYTDIIQSIKLRYNGLTLIPPNSYPNMKEMMLVRTVPLNVANPDGYLIMHLDYQ
jgi:two-component system response regulator YesN